MAIAMAALMLSGFNAYRLYFYERQEVRLRVTGAAIIESVLMFTNAGNRQAVVMSIDFLIPLGTDKYCSISTLFEDLPATPFVLEPADIKVLRVMHPKRQSAECGGQIINPGESSLGALIETTDWRGARHSTYVALAEPLVKKKGSAAPGSLCRARFLRRVFSGSHC
jgi:hypothetical protein